MNSEKIQQLHNEIQKEMKVSVNSSKIGDILQKYGISGTDFIKFQCILDFDKIQLTNEVQDEQLKSSLPILKEQKLVIVNCWCCEEPPPLCQCC